LRRLAFHSCPQLVLDVVIVVVELFIDAEFPQCGIIERDSVSCCPMPNGSCADNTLVEGSYAGLCYEPLRDSTISTACDPYKFKAVVLLHKSCFGIAVFILGCYEIELFLLFMILRRHFFRNKLYVIDTVVVTAALVLELAIKLTSSSNSGDVAGVLTFARCWRFVRLGHGLVSSVHEAHSGNVEALNMHVESLTKHVMALRDRLEELEEEELVRAGGKAFKKFGTRARRRSSALGFAFGTRKYAPPSEGANSLSRDSACWFAHTTTKAITPHGTTVV
jgi:hypothetical protein